MKSELSEKFDQLLKELVEQAFSDDMVSNEEYELINQIEVGLRN